MYVQHNSWVVQEIPAEWLPVHCETNRLARAIGWDCRACAASILSCKDICAECARHLTEASAIPGSRDVLTSEGSWQKFLAHAWQSRPMAPAGLFVSERTGSHSAGLSCTSMNYFVRRRFYVVLGPKPLLRRHKWLNFGKFQHAELFLIPFPRHISSRLPFSGETCKYAMDRSGSGWGPVEGSCEHGNEPSGSIKCWEVLEWLHNWQLLKKGSAP
jgi:hypothetical protein